VDKSVDNLLKTFMTFATSTIQNSTTTVFTFTDDFLDYLNFNTQLDLLLAGLLIFLLVGVFVLLIFNN
jgi:hypothetical protein